MRRLQYGLYDKLGALQKVLFGREQSGVALHFLGIERPAECLEPEASYERLTARARWRARNQLVRIAGAKRIPGQPFGRRAISFHKEGGQALRLILILEAVHIVLRRKLARWSGQIAKKIAN